MNVVFFGTPAFSVPFLQALHEDSRFTVTTVVCQPDKPVGRKKVLTTPATKQYAIANGISVLQPTSLKKEPINLEADVFVVVAYGKIIPQSILDLPEHGAINVHPSLLPLYRGPSPMQAAIANQDKETGISIMLLDAQMDHGPLLTQEVILLNGTETYTDLQAIVHKDGPNLLLDAIEGHVNGTIQAKQQNHEAATFCKLLSRENGHIDWNESAEAIEAKLRAYTPWPGIWTTWNNKTLKIHNASISEKKLQPGERLVEDFRLFFGTHSNALELHEVQLEGKQRMSVETFLHGQNVL